MVVGMDKLVAKLAGYEDAFVIIGGAACDIWFSSASNRAFRPTKDIDMVLVLEALKEEFVVRIKEFVAAGGYKPYELRDGDKAYYRFVSPSSAGYPKMLELFSGKPLNLELGIGQETAPIDRDVKSLSAILLDDSYRDLVLAQRETVSGVPLITPSGLIALKAKAWLDLSERKFRGEQVDQRHIKKHRNDVFRLAELLEAGSSTALPAGVLADLGKFLAGMQQDKPEWASILQSLGLKDERIVSGRIEAIRSHFVSQDHA